MRSFSKPTDDEVAAAIPHLSSPQHEEYFLRTLQNPYWIEHLRKHRFFAYPPAAQEVDGGGIRFPRWPASEYLARMAGQSPDEVVAIFSSVQTNNARIVGDILDAALAMPAATAVRLAPQVIGAAKANLLWGTFENGSILCARFAKERHIDAAKKLAEALFRPRFASPGRKMRHEDVYYYGRGLQHALPDLVVSFAPWICDRLCRWLQIAIEAAASPASGSDRSYIWRPAIEEHVENDEHELASQLVGFARDGFERAINNGLLTLDESFSILRTHSYLVFRRLRLHLINRFASKDVTLVRATMLNHELFDSFEYKHEYAEMVGNRWTMLTGNEQEEWLAWVDAGPNMAGFNESVKDNLGREATESDRQGRADYWRFEKLHWIRSYLVGERAAFYQRMLSEHGEPEFAYMNFRSTTRWGSQSPITVENLEKLTFTEAVTKVASWRFQDTGAWTPDVQGLATTFGAYVASRPEESAEHATELIGRRSILVRAYVSRVAEAIKAGKSINVAPVLQLCLWIVDQPVALSNGVDEEVDGWQWSRDAVSDFITTVCQAKSGDHARYILADARTPISDLLNPSYSRVRSMTGENIA